MKVAANFRQVTNAIHQGPAHERQVEIRRERNLRLVGTDMEVLVTGRSRKSDEELAGRTECNRVVNFRAPASLLGTLSRVRIRSASVNHLGGDWTPTKDFP